MWPSIAQNVVELLVPHLGTAVTRVFNKQPPPDTDASRMAMEQMAQGLRGDLGQVTASHAGLYRQLNEQSEKLSSIAADARTIKLQTVSLEDRLNALERRSSVLQTLSIGGLVLIFACFVFLLILFLRHP